MNSAAAKIANVHLELLQLTSAGTAVCVLA